MWMMGMKQIVSGMEESENVRRKERIDSSHSLYSVQINNNNTVSPQGMEGEDMFKFNGSSQQQQMSNKQSKNQFDKVHLNQSWIGILFGMMDREQRGWIDEESIRQMLNDHSDEIDESLLKQLQSSEFGMLIRFFRNGRSNRVGLSEFSEIFRF